MSDPEPRFVQVSRRAFLARTAIVGTLVAVPGLACASSDDDAFSAATGAGTGATTATTAATTPSTTTGSSTTTTSTAAASADGSTFPNAAELLVSFTFAASSSSRVANPYIAVWIEDPEGTLVDTISVWYKSGKGEKWLPDLRRWYAASDGAAETTMSGATRVAGSYTVSWDGTDLDGEPVPAGEYVLHIEAAREHGPYELVSGDLTIGNEPFRIELTPSGELTAASAELVVP